MYKLIYALWHELKAPGNSGFFFAKKFMLLTRGAPLNRKRC